MIRRSLAMIVAVGMLAAAQTGCTTQKMKEEQEAMRQDILHVTSDVDGLKVKIEELSKLNGVLTQKVDLLIKKQAELSAKLSAKPKPASKPAPHHKATRHKKRS